MSVLISGQLISLICRLKVLEKILACKMQLLSSLQVDSLAFSPLGRPSCQVLFITDTTKMTPSFFPQTEECNWLLNSGKSCQLPSEKCEVCFSFKFEVYLKITTESPKHFRKLMCLWDLSYPYLKETLVHCTSGCVAELLLIDKEIKLLIIHPSIHPSHLLWRDVKQHQYLGLQIHVALR